MTESAVEMQIHRIGVTGSRLPPTEVQAKGLRGILMDVLYSGCIPEVHHGCCVGVDEFAHDLCHRLAHEVDREIRVVAHPPDDDKLVYKMSLNAGLVMPPLPYLKRNRAIADRCDWLVALPDKPERLRSGTWSTVRYARRLGRPISILWADGEVTEEE
jgi:hypothetical protein